MLLRLTALAFAAALAASPALAAPCAGFTDVDDSSAFRSNVALNGAGTLLSRFVYAEGVNFPNRSCKARPPTG